MQFTTTQTFPEEQVISFSDYKGYQEEIGGQPNPETREEFITRLLREHLYQFTTSYAQYRVEQATEQFRQEKIQEVVEPIKDGLIINVE